MSKRSLPESDSRRCGIVKYLLMMPNDRCDTLQKRNIFAVTHCTEKRRDDKYGKGDEAKIC